jgi:hypothetical protein
MEVGDFCLVVWFFFFFFKFDCNNGAKNALFLCSLVRIEPSVSSWILVLSLLLLQVFISSTKFSSRQLTTLT